MAVLQLTKRLLCPAEPATCDGFALRHYRGEEDIEPWLALRRAAFAKERLGVRDWTRADFEGEILSRWWWKPERMWLAETALSDPLSLSAGAMSTRLIGAVILAFRGDGQAGGKPVVHWLVVHPRWRRRGIGKTLLAHLERAAWECDLPQIWLETHDAWDGAGGFYRNLGYFPVNANS